jgi:probable rRNA maturation factor
MINLDIARPYHSLVNSNLLIEAVQATLRHQGIQDKGELTLVITGNKTIRKLSKAYRQVDSPTDVLSFPGGHTDPDSGRTYLGDVIISYQQAKTQAVAAGHSVDDELRLLVVHGILHLLNYDHEEPSDKDRMWAAQAEILADLGSRITQPDNGLTEH